MTLGRIDGTYDRSYVGSEKEIDGEEESVFSSMPNELVSRIFSYLPKEHEGCPLVCRRWHNEFRYLQNKEIQDNYPEVLVRFLGGVEKIRKLPFLDKRNFKKREFEHFCAVGRREGNGKVIDIRETFSEEKTCEGMYLDSSVLTRMDIKRMEAQIVRGKAWITTDSLVHFVAIRYIETNKKIRGKYLDGPVFVQLLFQPESGSKEWKKIHVSKYCEWSNLIPDTVNEEVPDFLAKLLAAEKSPCTEKPIKASPSRLPKIAVLGV